MLRYHSPEEVDAFFWALAAERCGAEILNIMLVPSGQLAPAGWRVFARKGNQVSMAKELYRRISDLQQQLLKDQSLVSAHSDAFEFGHKFRVTITSER